MPTFDQRLQYFKQQLWDCGPVDEQLNWLVERSKHSAGLEEGVRHDSYLVPGCLSKLWLLKEVTGGRCCFRCDAEAAIVRALAMLYVEVYTELSPQEILQSGEPLAEQLQIHSFLSFSRRNVLLRMHQEIFGFAQQALVQPA